MLASDWDDELFSITQVGGLAEGIKVHRGFESGIQIPRSLFRNLGLDSIRILQCSTFLGSKPIPNPPKRNVIGVSSPKPSTLNGKL